MVMDGGIEMEESLRKMADTVKQKEEVLRQWQQMMIKSTHKKGPKEVLSN